MDIVVYNEGRNAMWRLGDVSDNQGVKQQRNPGSG